MKVSRTIYTTAFEDYKNFGLDPLPIPYDENGHPTKGPTILGWQIKAANRDYTEEDFSEPCNIGVLLGGAKNLTDIDCDSPEAVAIGAEIMEHLMEKTGKTMMFGRASKCRSHYVFFCDTSLESHHVEDPDDHEMIVEYRCVKQNGERGNQTVFPPSLWYEDGATEQIRLEDESASVPALVEATTLHECFRFIGAIALLAKHFPVESERHNTILALAGILARSGMPPNKAAMIVKLAYRHSGGYHGDQNKAEDDVRSVYTTFEKAPTTNLFGYPKLTEIMPKAVVDKVLDLLGIERPESHYTLTGTGNGRRLVDKHKDEILYCVDDGEWYVWDGVRWRKDVVKRIRELAKGIAADVRNEAHGIKPPTPNSDESHDKEKLSRYEARKREVLKWANQSENADRVSKTIFSAASDPRITCFRTDFDQHGDLLNCQNCVVNLYTGETMPHDRKLMMSNLCPGEYEPNAKHPTWDASLAAFTRNHPDLSPFLKRIAGYSIQGDKSEERILLLYGPGNAGKGTFMDWLTNALGPDYACAMDANSVLKQKRDSASASGDIARLEGKRIVVVSEIEKGSRVQESFMKQASGNDALVARGLYQSEREFRPTHQFWFQTNYRPGFDSTDSGNKRRYVEIPFDNDLKKDPLVEFDAKLKIRMRQDAEFLKAVLAWCVQGCIEWRHHGLNIPSSVSAATAELFAHNDFLKDFLTEMCIADPNEKVSVKELSDAYNRWCEGQGEEPAQGRTFNRMLEERGFERRQARIHGVSGKAWNGIRLKTHDELVARLPEDGSQEDIEDVDDDDLDGFTEEEEDPPPQPIFQEVPDELTEDWTHGVLIGGMATEASDIAVADAYVCAAEELIEPAIRSGEAWRFTYPILFLIRHALKIYLKAILKPHKLNHQLGPMVAELDRMLERTIGKALPADIRIDLDTLARIDPSGTSFRYTILKGKQGVSWVPLEGEYWIPLENLRHRMALIFEGLRNVEQSLGGRWAWPSQMWRRTPTPGDS